MAVTATTHSKPIGWSRSDVIDLIEQAHTTVGANTAAVSGLIAGIKSHTYGCLLYRSPSPRDYAASRMPSSA